MIAHDSDAVAFLQPGGQTGLVVFSRDRANRTLRISEGRADFICVLPGRSLATLIGVNAKNGGGKSQGGNCYTANLKCSEERRYDKKMYGGAAAAGAGGGMCVVNEPKGPGLPNPPPVFRSGEKGRADPKFSVVENGLKKCPVLAVKFGQSVEFVDLMGNRRYAQSDKQSRRRVGGRLRYRRQWAIEHGQDL